MLVAAAAMLVLASGISLAFWTEDDRREEAPSAVAASVEAPKVAPREPEPADAGLVTPVREPPVHETPVHETPVHEPPVREPPVHEPPAKRHARDPAVEV